MSRYTLSPAARDDLDSIWDYIGIEQDKPAAAVNLLEMLYVRFNLLARNPLIGEFREDLADLVNDIRSFVAGSFVIYYQPVTSGVRIGRVVHGARDARALFSAPSR